MPFDLLKYLRRKRRKKKAGKSSAAAGGGGSDGGRDGDTDAAAAAGGEREAAHRAGIDGRPANSTSRQGQAPPRLDGLALSSPLAIRSGESAVITVRTSGLPAPVVTWLLGNKEVRQGSEYQLSQQGSQHTLVITRVGSELQKKGLFVVAKNCVGEVQRQLDLQVYRDSVVRGPRRSRLRLSRDGRSMTSLDAVSVGSSVTSSQNDSTRYKSYSPCPISLDDVFESSATYHSAEGLLENAEQQRLYQERLKELNAHEYPPKRAGETDHGRKPRSASMITAPPRDQLKAKPWESPRSTGNLLQDSDDVYYSLPSRGKVAEHVPDVTKKSTPWYKPKRLPRMSPEHSVSSPNISSPAHTDGHGTRGLYDLDETMTMVHNGYSEPQLLLTQTDIVGHAALGSLPSTVVPRAPWPSILKPGKKASKRWQLSAGKPPPKPHRVSWISLDGGRGAEQGWPLRHSLSGPIATNGPTPSDFVSKSDFGEMLGHNQSSPRPVVEVEIHKAPSKTVGKEVGKADVKLSYIEKQFEKERAVTIKSHSNSGGGGLHQLDQTDDGKMVPNHRYTKGISLPSQQLEKASNDAWQISHRRKKRVSFSDSNPLIDENGLDKDSMDHNITTGHKLEQAPTKVAQESVRTPFGISGNNVQDYSNASLSGKGHFGFDQRYSPVTWSSPQAKVVSEIAHGTNELPKACDGNQDQGYSPIKQKVGSGKPHGAGASIGKPSSRSYVPTQNPSQLHADMSKKELKLLSKSFNTHLGDGRLHTSMVEETHAPESIRETGTLTNAEQYQFMNALSDSRLSSNTVLRLREANPNIAEKDGATAALARKANNTHLSKLKSKQKPIDVTKDPFDDIPYIDEDCINLDQPLRHQSENVRTNKENIQPQKSTKTNAPCQGSSRQKNEIHQSNSDKPKNDHRPRRQPGGGSQIHYCTGSNKSNTSSKLNSLDFDQILLLQTDTFLIDEDATPNSRHPPQIEDRPQIGTGIPKRPELKGSKCYRMPQGVKPHIPRLDQNNIHCTGESQKHERMKMFNDNMNNSSNDRLQPESGTPRGVLYIEDGADDAPCEEEMDMVDGLVAIEVHIDTHIRTEERGELYLKPVDSELKGLERYVESVVDHAYSAVQEEYDMQPDGREEAFVKTAIGHACAEVCQDIEHSGNTHDNRVFRNAAAEHLAQSAHKNKMRIASNSTRSPSNSSNGIKCIENISGKARDKSKDSKCGDEVISVSHESELNAANKSGQKWTRVVCEGADTYVAVPDLSTPQYKPSFRSSPSTRGSYYSSYIEDPYASDALSDISEGDESASIASRSASHGASGQSNITWEDVSDTEDPYAGHVDISDDEAIDDKFPDIVRTLPESTRIEECTPAVHPRTKINERPLQILTPLSNGNPHTNGCSSLNDSKDSGVVSGTEMSPEIDSTRGISLLKSLSFSPTETIADVHYIGDSHSVPPDVCAKMDLSPSLGANNNLSSRSTSRDSSWSNQIKHISFRTKRAHTDIDLIKSSEDSLDHNHPFSGQSTDTLDSKPDLDPVELVHSSLTVDQVVEPMSSSPLSPGRKVHVVSRIDSFVEEMRRYKGAILLILLAMVIMQMFAVYLRISVGEGEPRFHVSGAESRIDVGDTEPRPSPSL